MFDAEVEVLPDAPRSLKTRQRVRVHVGTAEVLARVAVIDGAGEIAPGEKGFVQLRLESPLVAVMGERFIIRSYSPQATIAGGAILRPAAVKPRKKERPGYLEVLQRLKEASDQSAVISIIVGAAGEHGVDIPTLRAITGWRSDILADAAARSTHDGRWVEAGGVYIAKRNFADLRAKAAKAVESHHETDQLAKGMPLESLRERVFRFVPVEVQRAAVASLVAEKVLSLDRENVSLASRIEKLSGPEAQAAETLRAIYEKAGIEVPKTEEALAEAVKAGVPKPTAQKLLRKLVDAGEIRQISPEFCFGARTVDGIVEKVRRFAAGSSDRLIDVSRFKELAGVSRKYAIPLLEYFDREKITVRRGDQRYVL
jgi:selenocysteine-specific elongation factor